MNEKFLLFSKLHPNQAAEVKKLCESLRKISDRHLSVIECVPELETDGKSYFSVEKITMKLEKKGEDITLSQLFLNQIREIIDEDFYWYLSSNESYFELSLRSRNYHCGFVTVKTHNKQTAG